MYIFDQSSTGIRETERETIDWEAEKQFGK